MATTWGSRKVLRDTGAKTLRELAGRRVRLLGRHETRGGTVFKDGEELVVASVWRGRFVLRDPKNSHRTIRQVSPFDLEWLPL